MYEVAVVREFAAAHFLRDYNGPCEHIHGHNYLVEVVVRGEKLDERGLLVDFRDLKSWVDEVIGEMDHKLLNELPAFDGRSPTSEALAEYIYRRVEPRASEAGVGIVAVTVWENSRSRATYIPETAKERSE